MKWSDYSFKRLRFIFVWHQLEKEDLLRVQGEPELKGDSRLVHLLQQNLFIFFLILSSVLIIVQTQWSVNSSREQLWLAEGEGCFCASWFCNFSWKETEKTEERNEVERKENS